MKEYLKNLSNQLKNHSKSLDKKSILIDKPWAMIDGEFEIQKLIFKKNKELILSRNGKVQEGRWDYYPEAKSLLIDRGTDKILCNEAFIDEGVMILKMDGTNNRFFALANENIVPDFDVESYLLNVRATKFQIISRKLKDGRSIEILPSNHGMQHPQIGDAVYHNSEPLEDGLHNLAEKHYSYKISAAQILNIYTVSNFTHNGLMYQLHIAEYSIQLGDLIYRESKLIDDDIIPYKGNKKLVVKSSVIKDIIYANPIINWFQHL